MDRKEVNEIIDKHMGFHKRYLEHRKMILALKMLVSDGKDAEEIMDDIKDDQDMNAHSSALAALEMLKSEINGEHEW